MQKQSNEYAKRTKAVLKELQKKFQPKSVKERIGYNMMMPMFIDEVAENLKEQDPARVKEEIETLIKRLMWIIE